MEFGAISRPRLLIVDDEVDLCNVLKEVFSEEFRVRIAHNGAEALQVTHSWFPEVILMDIMMPIMNGIDACVLLRKDEATRHIPILMLTANVQDESRMKAFSLGADDYMSKPFNMDELLIRIKSKVCRAREMSNAPKSIVVLANLSANLASHEVKIDGKLIELSPVEYRILQILLVRQGEVISREEIVKAVWDEKNKNDRLLDAHLTAIRKKLLPFQGEIQTIYGEGYRIKS